MLPVCSESLSRHMRKMRAASGGTVSSIDIATMFAMVSFGKYNVNLWSVNLSDGKLKAHSLFASQQCGQQRGS